jgi:hypothetical protein
VLANGGHHTPLRSCVNTPNTHENFVLKRKPRKMQKERGVGGQTYRNTGRGFEKELVMGGMGI